MGSLIAAYMLRYGWGWSFIVPGAFIAVSGEQLHVLYTAQRCGAGGQSVDGHVLAA